MGVNASNLLPKGGWSAGEVKVGGVQAPECRGVHGRSNGVKKGWSLYRLSEDESFAVVNPKKDISTTLRSETIYAATWPLQKRLQQYIH